MKEFSAREHEEEKTEKSGPGDWPLGQSMGPMGRSVGNGPSAGPRDEGVGKVRALPIYH